mmetsp:Transcript_10431/g.14594  ORF Transcript_10431/g.14594 Transcript_10431/m.14594 type:complete len:751 (-) Transcript_10431:217-2469(-)
MVLRNPHHQSQRSYRRSGRNQYQKVIIWSIFILSNLICAALASGFPHHVTQGGGDDGSHDMLMERHLSEDTPEGEDGPEGETEPEEENEEFDTMTEVTAAVVIGAIIIVLTIMFELVVDFLLEWVHPDMKPVIEAAVGELTVLGFVSLFTFVITRFGIIKHISEEIFYGDDGEKLVEIFEDVHFTLFGIMAFFVLKVLSIVRRSIYDDKMWEALNAQCVFQQTDTERDDSDHLSDNASGEDDAFRESGSASPAPSTQFLTFRFMRDEFIKDRSVVEPFEPSIALRKDEENENDYNAFENLLSEDFDFGRYLSIRQVHILKHLVHVEPLTWLALLSPVGILYAIYHAAVKDIVVLSWAWIVFGWLSLLHLFLIGRHIKKIRRAFSTSDTAALKDLNLPIMQSNNDNEEQVLPAWCYIDIETYNKNRSRLRRWILGEKPVNRQEVLFAGERYGRKILLLSFHTNFLFQVFYTGLIYTFVNQIWGQYDSGGIRALYIILSIVPALLFLFPNRILISGITEITSVGIFRSSLAIAETIRERKITAMVRTLIFLHKMRSSPLKESTKNTTKLRSKSFKNHEKLQILDTFHAFNMGKDGELGSEDFRRILSHIGASAQESQILSFIQKIDSDGSGEVSMDEFLQWYKKEFTTEVDAAEVFEMLDRRGAGVLTMADLKAFIDGFLLNFTIHDIGELIRELDQDKDGLITEKEFERLLEVYSPHEMRRKKTRCYTFSDLCIITVDFFAQRIKGTKSDQ